MHHSVINLGPQIYPVVRVASSSAWRGSFFGSWSRIFYPTLFVKLLPGNNWLNGRQNHPISIIRDVSDGNVVLVSEDGEAIMRIHVESLASAGFEPFYD